MYSTQNVYIINVSKKTDASVSAINNNARSFVIKKTGCDYVFVISIKLKFGAIFVDLRFKYCYLFFLIAKSEFDDAYHFGICCPQSLTTLGFGAFHYGQLPRDGVQNALAFWTLW